MVTHTQPREAGTFRKVSKPLMEKKRRARINVSLEQLKSLLEKNYSQNIRKRKLEKADILELTVKYLKTLQNVVQAGAPVLRSAEYQAGFQSCLSSVSRFLMRSEEPGNISHHYLVQDLSMTSSPASGPCFRTKDSDYHSPNTHATPPANLSPDHKPNTHDVNMASSSPDYRQTKPTLAPRELSHFPASTDRSPAPAISHSPVILSPSSERSPGRDVWRPW
ncbi:transcription factor HES-3 [Pseudophryne corroboree]|uniref:transcription factor HES-3 n=1 Tax=Pseudophryne corroboree TaxID=495146 RepID=UPI003081571E